MGLTRYYLSLSFYEQLRLPFLNNFAEGVMLRGKWTVDKSKLLIISHGNVLTENYNTRIAFKLDT